MKVKKLLGIVLTLAVLIQPAAAYVNTPTTNDFKLYDYQSNIISFINVEEFNDAFRIDDSPTNSLQEEPAIEYTYTVDGIDNEKYNVQLDFRINVNNQHYDISTSGICYSNMVNSNLNVIEGGLTGECSIDGIDYTVTVGFIKAIGDDTITAGVTFIPVICNEVESIFRFSFGGAVITSEMLPKDFMEEPNSNPIDKTSDTVLRYREHNFRRLTRSTAGISSSSYGGSLPTGIAQTLSMYYDDQYKVGITIASNTETVNETFDVLSGSGATWSTSIQDLTLGLRRTGRTGAEIDNFDSLAFASEYTVSDKAGTFEQMLTDILSSIEDYGKYAPIVGTLYDILSDASTSTFESSNPAGDIAEITMRIGLFDHLVLDDESALPLIINLDGSKGDSGTFYAYGDLSYRTNVVLQGILQTYYSYVTTDETARHILTVDKT